MHYFVAGEGLSFICLILKALNKLLHLSCILICLTILVILVMKKVDPVSDCIFIKLDLC